MPSLLLRLHLTFHSRLRTLREALARASAPSAIVAADESSRAVAAPVLRGAKATMVRALCVVLFVNFVGGPAAVLRACDDDSEEC